MTKEAVKATSEGGRDARYCAVAGLAQLPCSLSRSRRVLPRALVVVVVVGEERAHGGLARCMRGRAGAADVQSVSAGSCSLLSGLARLASGQRARARGVSGRVGVNASPDSADANAGSSGPSRCSSALVHRRQKLEQSESRAEALLVRFLSRTLLEPLEGQNAARCTPKTGRIDENDGTDVLWAVSATAGASTAA